MIRPLTFLFHLGYRPDQVLFSSMCEDNIHPYEHPLYRCIPALNKTVTPVSYTHLTLPTKLEV